MCAELLKLDIALEFDGFSLSLDEDLCAVGVTAVFGPSGSGKSSLLRTIAGFEKPSAGCIGLGEDVWFDSGRGMDVPAYQRPVGFLFQDARLFSHLNVAGNLAFAEQRSQSQGASFQLEDLLKTFDLEALLPRRIDKLSGGERQRVALARTLLSRPRLLLLDEPLSALDRELKAEILPYLDRTQDEFHVPTLYVSHDIDEVAHLANHVLVLVDGKVAMRGTVNEVFSRLDVAMMGERYEAGVLVEGRVDHHDDRLEVTLIDLAGDLITMPRMPELPVGSLVRLRIRARDVALATERPQAISIRNVLPGTLVELHSGGLPGQVEAKVRLRGAEVRARLTKSAVEELKLVPGMQVFALVKSAGLAVS